MLKHDGPGSSDGELAEAGVIESPCRPDNTAERPTTQEPWTIQFGPRWRVVADGLQWILESSRKSSDGRPAWQGRKYCTTRNGLLLSIREAGIDADATALDAIKRLPATFREWGRA